MTSIRNSNHSLKLIDALDGVSKIADSATNDIRTLSQRLQNNEINISEWQIQMSSIIKRAYIASLVKSRDGRQNISRSDLGTIGNIIRQQYKYLSRFAISLEVKIEAGTLSDSFINRAVMYASAIITNSSQIERIIKGEQGFTQERRILSGSNHCDDCIRYANQGWVGIGTLPALGQDCACITNCRCRFRYK